ncbi:hypothetical protein [Aeropyrum camini]|uniref:Uncharacterized protein n=1 Tax=Aeropyrum camini SY1 = JCM 12091 TaxID=1198449 RepID=U3TFV2_9CREN|nr:hypothetical protein [Aeropyrum camini]BAN90920.1 hypothetical protein ACAM_1451 [Aeropyrum camini SY1 = JCM 12091]
MLGGVASISVGAFLIILGLGMVGFVFYTAYDAYNTFRVEVEPAASIAEAITVNSSILIDMLVKVAFLAIALAAGSVVLSRGVDLFRGCPKERG